MDLFGFFRFIIKELIQTEKTYVDDLKCCIDVIYAYSFTISLQASYLCGSSVLGSNLNSFFMSKA